MKKRLLAIGLLAFLVGCGQQPQLEISTEQNQTTPTKTTVEKKVVETTPTKTEQTQPVETDLTDNTNIIEISQNSGNMENNSSNDIVNQNLAQSLSKKIVHFDFDKYNIKSSQLPIVQDVANLLKNAKSNFTVRIEGNCDEWGTDEYNYALGLKRAKILKQALIDLGVNKDKLTIISYGESNPVCTAHNKECWAKNRRDNFTLLP